LLDQITDCVGHLLDRYGRIDAVLIEQVDTVDAKPAHRAFYRLTDMLRPAVSVGADLLIALETKPLRQTRHLIAAG
jgi:hypothetical protein